MDRPLPVEGRRRLSDRRSWSRRGVGAGNGCHSQRREDPDRLSLSLRFCDVDRGRRINHLVHVRLRRPVMTTWPILFIVTFLPIVGALIIYVSRGEDEAARLSPRWISLWTTLVTFAISLIMYWRFEPANPHVHRPEKPPRRTTGSACQLGP